MSSTIIHTRMSRQLKNEVEAILKKLGLTPSEAIRLYFAQIAHKKCIPFSLDLEKYDVEEEYLSVNDADDLKQLIELCDVSAQNS